MTKREGAIISAFTGIMVGSFLDMHEYSEKIMGTTIFTHQFASKRFCEKLKAKAKPDFISLCDNLTEGE